MKDKENASQEANNHRFIRQVHHPEPDYSRPVYEVPSEVRERLITRLSFLYGPAVAEEYLPEIERLMKVYYAHKPPEMIELEKKFVPENRFTQEDVILITYGDLIKDEDKTPLAALAEFSDKYLEGTINTIHILPFFPFSSDRGFSIVDFEVVDPRLGTWRDIERLEERYQLMFDGVINHVSSKSRWFQEFLNGNNYYREFFIAYTSWANLTPEQREIIFRPRTSDILTRFQTINGGMHVWTTFSQDQIDLNYKNPQVLMRVLDVLLTYVRRGADIIRLDAVTYIWSEPGTRCVHLDQTHEIVKLFHDILEAVAPTVAMITETNVPHEENISYFGNGRDEAQMVYNFALPPLVLHAFYREDASALAGWAADLTKPSMYTNFFNFLDSHDGVGLMAVKNILPQEEIDFIIEKAKENGALISYKTGENGHDIPYEINTTWFSALNRDDSDESDELQMKRFIASRAVALALQGVPGIYLLSIFGTENDLEAAIATHSNRAINRTFLDAKAVSEAMADPSSKAYKISRQLGRLIYTRTKKKSFHPNAPQKVLRLAPEVLALLRTAIDGTSRVLALTNVSSRRIDLHIAQEELGSVESDWYNLNNGRRFTVKDGKLTLFLEPYDVAWLQPFTEVNGDAGNLR